MEQISHEAARGRLSAQERGAWYRRAAQYWEKKEATVKGMLDGYDCVSSVDLEASLLFLDKIKTLPAYKGSSCRFDCALDCGAGIGRVTKGCLLRRFARVDMVEPSAKFVSEARQFVQSDRLVDIFQVPLQDFHPQKQYDCIWLQWCVLYLTDTDLVALLERCAAALRPRGVICVKENVSEDEEEIDLTDNSILRTDKHYREIFKQANLRLLLDMKQPKFPATLFPVRMYCLRSVHAMAQTDTSESSTTAAVPL